MRERAPHDWQPRKHMLCPFTQRLIAPYDTKGAASRLRAFSEEGNETVTWNPQRCHVPFILYYLMSKRLDPYNSFQNALVQERLGCSKLISRLENRPIPFLK